MTGALDRALVVAAPDQATEVRSLAAHPAVRGVVWQPRPVAAPLELPRHDTVEEGLADLRPEALCVLTPYRALGRDLERAAEAGVACLCAGPPASIPRSWRALAARHQWTGPLGAAPELGRLRELRGRDAFGEAVYLRWVTGGGRGVLRAWWSVRQQICAAIELLASPPRSLHVMAGGHARALHATATVATESGATAQLVTCPRFVPGPGQVLLLSTGGLLEAAGEPGLRFAEPQGRGELWDSDAAGCAVWLDRFLEDPTQPLEPLSQGAALDRPLLEALRRSRSLGAPQVVPL